MADRDVANTPTVPGEGLNLQDASVVIDLFDRAAQANLNSPLRCGACVRLDGPGTLIVSGDLHDHGLNFRRLLKLAALHKAPDRHLVLHEIVHGEHRINGRDLSVRMLARVAALQLQYPGQVHWLQANHELAQLGGEGILKDGHSVVEAFDEGVDFIYDRDADAVRQAMTRLIRSLFLAVRCGNGVFVSHSLPSARVLDGFDLSVLDRVPTEADLAVDGPGYQMVWGRKHTEDVAQRLKQAWGAKVFVMGHQPAEMGYEVEGESMLVIASDHDHGVALSLDLSQPYDLNGLIGQIIPLASVVL